MSNKHSKFPLRLLIYSIMLFHLFSISSLFATPLFTDPFRALEALKEGNKHFLNQEFRSQNILQDQRMQGIEKQHPFVIILGCSDSRVPPELIFNLGIGEAFVIRVAGNVLGDEEFESIKYSVLVNHSCLILVLGHENCGAVNAVLQHQTQEIPHIARRIAPVIKKGSSLKQAIYDNLEHITSTLKTRPVLKELIDQGKLQVVGGYYHFQTGKVDFFK